ncbi:hypothetical protein [Reinekea sp.]|jgi:uncharacterized protein YjiS (DUF1127 family)|uniref:hypothetical protein n=1 Tax=Reinekea sp. TaxID=1970455 RepID=UPI003988C6BE
MTTANLQPVPKTIVWKIKQWRTRQILGKLDSSRLKDIGVNQWDLRNARTFNTKERT